MDGGGDIANAQALGDGEAHLAAHLPGAACHDRRADQHASSIRDELDESILVVITLGAIDASDVPLGDGSASPSCSRASARSGRLARLPGP